MCRLHGCTLLFLCALAKSACAATLTGQVAMRAPAEDGSRAVPSQAVVWLDSIPAKTESDLARGPKRGPFGWFGKRTAPEAPRLKQVRGRFEPRVVHVPAGRVVVISNTDSLWHGVFSVSRVRPFELGKRAPGGVDSVKFDKPGVVQLRCELHPEESAFIVVTPNHAAAQPAENGDWTLPKLPKGRYVLRAWAPGRPELRREVDISNQSQVTLTLRW